MSLPGITRTVHGTATAFVRPHVAVGQSWRIPVSDALTYLAIAAAVVVIALDLLAIISVFKSDRSVGAKALWALGIAVFPVLGLVFWLIAGVQRR